MQPETRRSTVRQDAASRDFDPRAAVGTCDPRTLVRSTISALAHLDAATLLSLEAQAADATRISMDAIALRELNALKQSLEELLQSTHLSLKTLHALHHASLHAAEETLWAR